MKGNDKLAMQCAMLMACASAFGYSNPIEGGSTETVTNQWTVAVPWLMVGSNSDSNTLEVVNGGLVYNQIGYLGNTTGSTHNQAIITGSGVWSNTIELSVGYAGASNSLTVADGGLVTTPNAYIGNNSDGNAVIVTGSDSLLDAAILDVGYQGDENSLMVTDGGAAESDVGTIGYWIGSDNNTAAVQSNGTWNNSSELNVGEYGAGNQLMVGAGGFVESPVANVGVQSISSNNTVTVTGEGAWLDAPELYIGGSAAGAGGIGNLVEVETGGTVYTKSLNIYSNNAFDLNDGGRLFVNTNFSASINNFNWNAGGTLEVGGELTGMTNSIEDQRTLVLNGSSAQWNKSSSDIKVGEFTGSNALSIVNGGYLETAEAYIGYASGADSNSVLVSGSNTVWDNSSDLYIGYQGSGNSLVVTDGAEVNTSYARVGVIGSDSNSLVVANGGSFLSTGSLVIGGFYPPNLLSTDNSLVITNGGNVQSGGGALTISSSALVSGTGSSWFIEDHLTISQESNLLVNEGGTFSAAGLSLGMRTSGQLIVSGQGSMLEISGSDFIWDLEIDGVGSLMRVEDGGQILVDGASKIDGADHSVIVTGSNSLWNSRVLGVDGSQNAVVIEDGGALVSTDSHIGDLSGTSNSVLVTGDSSIWHNTGFLLIGNAGSYNSLTIEDGGLVANGDSTFDYRSGSTIGYQSGSDYNSVLVTGEGSLWQSYNNLHLGGRYEAVLTESGYVIKWTNGGYGNSLTVEDGGRVLVGNVDTNALADIGGGIIVGDSDGAEMVVANASSVQAENSWIGLGSNERGTVEVRGSGSVWTNRGDISIGYYGSHNTLDITAGGTVNSENGYIGYSSGADSNSVLVTGSGSVWQNDEGLYLGGHYEGTNWIDGGTGNSLAVEDGGRVLVGDVDTNALSNLGGSGRYGDIAVGDASGTAEMIIANGSVVESGLAIIGLGADESGAVIVTGSSSVWDNSRVLTIGHDGANNNLTVENGGRVDSSAGSIGIFSDNNSVLITGNGSAWNVSKYLVVGNYGASNDLTIEGGGRVECQTGSIGYSAGGSNSVLVTGSGSVWHNSFSLDVGRKGASNNLTIEDGGRVECQYSGIGYATGADSNSVLVTGSGSVWTNSSDVHIGYGGSYNTLNITEGGAVYNENGYIGYDEMASGNAATVSGNWSTWSNGGQLHVGYNGSDNSLRVGDKGHVYAWDGMTIGHGASATSNQVAVSGNGSFLNSGAPLMMARPLIWTNYPPIPIDEGGGLISSGGGSIMVVQTFGGLNPMPLIFGSGNTINIASGGTVSNENGYIGYSAGADSNAELVSRDGAVLEVSTNLIVGSVGSSNTLVIVPDTFPAIFPLLSVDDLYGQLVVGHDGSYNSLDIEDGGLTASGTGIIGATSNAWFNSVSVSGDNSRWMLFGNLYIGGRLESGAWNDGGLGNVLHVADGGLVDIAFDLHNRNYSTVNMDPGGLVSIGGDYYQDASSMLRFGVETNAAGAPLNALITVGGTAEFEEGAQIEYASNVGELLFDRFYTNKLIEADALVVAGIANPDSLDLELLNASGSLVDVIFWEHDQDIYALAGRKYLAESAGFEEGTMMARLSKEIDDMSLLGNSDAMSMIDLLNTMSGSEQNEQLVQEYAYSTPGYLHIQGMTEGLSELTKHTSRRPVPAPEGAAGPYSVDRGARGWIRPYGSWSDRSAHDGFAGYDHNVYGTIVGMDWIQSNVLLGVAGGYARSNIKQDDGDVSKARTGYGVFYASLGTQDWFGDISFAAGRSDIEDESGTAFGAHADYKASNFALYLGGGKELRSRTSMFSFTPKASLLLSDYYQNAYTEQVSSSVARDVPAYGRSSILSSLGAAVAMQKEYDSAILRPEARLRWLHEFNSDVEQINFTLSEGMGGQYYSLMPAAEEDVLEVGTGITCTFHDELSLALDLDWRFGEDYDAYSVSGRAVVEF